MLADPAEWQRDPWSGDVVDGELWGRGAQDMKSQTAAEVTAALALAQSGWRPAHGDLLVVCVVDEETGGGEGAVWLTEQPPRRACAATCCSTRARARVFPFGDERVYGVCVAEKGVFRFTVTHRGRRRARLDCRRWATTRCSRWSPSCRPWASASRRYDVTETPRALLAGAGASRSTAIRRPPLDALRERDPMLAMLVEPMLGVTLAPTRIFASEKINVIPSRATLAVDCRTPPGMEEDEVRARIEDVLGTNGYELEFTEKVVGNSSPPDSPLMDALRGWIAREDPEARVVPTMLPAFTDSRTFRAAFPECVAYGFFPQREMNLYETSPLVHSRDERIATADLGFAARCYRDVTQGAAG